MAFFQRLIRNPSHVAKTGDIKEFVITEESGIAKGIRRIIAVTGHDALEVTRKAHSLKTKLDHIDSLTGKDKDAALKVFTVVCLCNQINEFLLTSFQELGQSDISVIIKAELRNRLAAIRKAFDKQNRDREAAINKTVSVSGNHFLNRFISFPGCRSPH